MKTKLVTRATIALGATVVTAACGGGGPGVSGPEAQALFADYSATWVLDADVSDSVPSARPGMSAGEGRGGGDPFGGGARPGGGMAPGGMPPGGGMTPGGMSGGGRGRGGGRGGMGGRGPGGGMNPEAMEAMRHTMTMARQRPESITLALDDSTFSVAQSPGGRASVPTMGDEVELNRSSWPVKAKVEWDDGTPSLKRAFENGGTIVERFELVARDRLVVTRRVEGVPFNDFELRFVYDREAAEGGSPR